MDILIFLACGLIIGFIFRQFKRTSMHSIGGKSLGDGKIVFFDEEEKKAIVYADEEYTIPLMNPVRLDKYGGHPKVYISEFCYAGFLTSDGKQLGHGEIHKMGEFLCINNLHTYGDYEIKTRYLWRG